MNKRKLQVVCGLMCSLTILLSGCNKESSQTGKEHDELKKENTTLAKENSKLEGKYEELEEKVEVLKQELDGLNSMLENKESNNSENKANEEELVRFPIYEKEQGSEELKIVTSTSMRYDLTLQQKLESLASNLADIKFNEFIIKVESIKDKKAVIRIKEKEEKNYENSGAKRYFSDVVQAELNNTCLVETFLQKQYKEEWIESIEIIYDGPEAWKGPYTQSLEGTYTR